MKKILLATLMIILAFPLFCQGTFDTQIEKSETKIDSTAENPLIELFGFVERGIDDNIVIIENPESRSRISYYVAENCSAVADLLGNYIHVKGYIKEHSSQWVKEISVTEILAFSSVPFDQSKKPISLESNT